MFFWLFRMGDGAANFGKAVIAFFVVCVLIGLLVSGCNSLLHPGAEAHAKEVQCYAGQIGPPAGGYDCINWVQPNWRP